LVLGLLFVGLLPGRADAQGNTDYLNFESPQIKPLAVATVGESDYLLACNTPDNSVSIADITGGTFRWTTRVPVGLEPVSVLWVPSVRTGGGSDVVPDHGCGMT
jgi:hypothetical protein